MKWVVSAAGRIAPWMEHVAPYLDATIGLEWFMDTRPTVWYQARHGVTPVQAWPFPENWIIA